MSKDWKKWQQIRKKEMDDDLKHRSNEYAKEHNLDDASAPSIEGEEGVVKNTQSMHEILSSIAKNSEAIKELMDADGETDYDRIKANLQIIKATCQVAIGKIETGW